MITSLLLDQKPDALLRLENKINECCPNVVVTAATNCLQQANQVILERKPDLLFLDVETGGAPLFNLSSTQVSQDLEVVFLTNEKSLTLDVMKKCSIQYLSKPIVDKELIAVANAVEFNVQRKKEATEIFPAFSKLTKFKNDLIGIPTMEGYEFIPAHKIIRCEGLQKCTRVVTQDRSDIVSSYNLGVFKKILQPFGFFLPHKSFLINLSLIKKFHKERTITMIDNAYVPLARRKRNDFLNLIPRLAGQRSNLLMR